MTNGPPPALSSSEKRLLTAGTLFGLCFPLMAWAIDLWLMDLAPSLASLRRIHEVNRIHLIVDLAPFVLGAAGYLLGTRERRILDLNAELEATVARRTQQLRNALETAQAASDESKVAREEAENALEARTRFLAGMGHELRTPLTGIIGWLELLETKDMNKSQLKAVSVARRSAGSLLDVIGSVLDFAKADRGALELEHTPVDVIGTLQGVYDLLLPSTAEKDILLTLEVGGGMGKGWFVTDGPRLRQVMVNLAANAVKFTEVGEVKMKVDARGGRVYFEVTDSGIGMTKEAAARIFQPFVQADESTTRRFGGSGLGLAIAARIVEAMGGEVRVESVVGTGSRFFFDLALLPTEPLEIAEVDTSNDAVQGMRVLVVDDSPLAAEVAVAQLESLGADPEWVTNGEAAIARVAEARFDLVLMDRHMPGIDGFEATRRIRAAEGSGPRTPIVALSASALPEELQEGRRAGMDASLLKPLPRSALAKMLNRFRPEP